jgi:ATP-binding cassette, subfamily C (CFTR/MRP), member 10
MSNSELTEIIPLAWNWSDVCPDGLKPWASDYKDLSLCFQQICLQIPALVFVSITSGYFYGRYNLIRIRRNTTQSWLILIRLMVTIVLAMLPAIKILFMIRADVYIWPIDVTINCIEFFAWFVHLGFLHSLQKKGTLSHRGPLGLTVLWSIIFILYGIWLRSNYNSSRPLNYPIIQFVLISLYGVTLIPKGQATFRRIGHDMDEERRALLDHSYIRFQDDIEEQFQLGSAHDGSNFFSKLVFHWVNPLISKGVAGLLRKNEDLFDLPDCLSPRIAAKLQSAITDTRTLFKALHKCFGLEFYSVGLLRLIADISAFAGPLLLGGFLSQTVSEGDGTDLKPYFYAGGLFLSTLICKYLWQLSISF